MTKEEFEQMINAEINDLQVQYYDLLKNYQKNEINDIDKRNLKYMLDLFNRNIIKLRTLVSLPAYARIQAMSDIEIDTYKNEKLEEFELKVKEYEAVIEQHREKFEQLKAEKALLISQMGSLFGSQRVDAIARSEKIDIEIGEHDPNNMWNEAFQSQKKLDEIREQREKFRAMTSQDVKKLLSSKIDNSIEISKVVDIANGPTDNFNEALGRQGWSGEAAYETANLMWKYAESESERLYETVFLAGLPKELDDAIKNSVYYDFRNSRVYNPTELLKIVEEYEESFSKAKTYFNEQFTESKLIGLAKNNFDINSIDINFIQLHADKLGAGELAHLQSLVEQRKKLSNKIFKSKETKKIIDKLDFDIKNEMIKICNEILGWYQSYGKSTLGLESFVDFSSVVTIQSSLKSLRDNVTHSENSLMKFKKNLEIAQERMEQNRQNIESRKKEILSKIGEPVDLQIDDSNSKINTSRDFDQDINIVANSVSSVFERSVVGRVQEQAQLQADKKEAELRGVTIEQLKQMKEIAQALSGKATRSEEIESTGKSR